MDKKMCILFPSSYFDYRRVDEDLSKEYEAVMESGNFGVILYNQSMWENQKKLYLHTILSDGTSDSSRNAILRGWMMKPEDYARFYDALLKLGVHLVTYPEHYNTMHLFPNIYEVFKSDTPKIKTYPLFKQIDVSELNASFKRFMVKDYVKSVKGTDKFPAFFETPITQEEFDKAMEVFYQFRAGLLTGGICIKEYVDLKRYNGVTNEYRTFYLNHAVTITARNSSQPKDLPQPPISLIQKYQSLTSPYYTIDFAELSDGSWKILEAGDGSVSSIPEMFPYSEYFTYLNTSFTDTSMYQHRKAGHKTFLEKDDILL